MHLLAFIPSAGIQPYAAPPAAWNWELWVLIPLTLSVLIYVAGATRAWRHAGPFRGLTLPHCLRFLGGILALIIAVVSPLDAMSQSLFSAHMVQHQILMLLAAPLLATSGFLIALMRALPRPWGQSLAHAMKRSFVLPAFWRLLSHPVSAWLLFALPLWLWHASSLYQAALEDEALHVFEHLSFLFTSMLFWWVLFKPSTQRHLHYAMAVPYLFTTSLHSSVLSALMIFATRPWYPYYASLTAAWGLCPLEDQQLAGLIMWVPGGVVLTLLTIGYFAAWLRALEQRLVPRTGRGPH